jgi:hypothetical protein
MKKGGYYNYPYIDDMFSDEEKTIINEIKNDPNTKFIDNNYKINIQKFYEFIVLSKTRSYEEMIKFLVNFYNPYYDLDKINNKYTLIDVNSKVINDDFEVGNTHNGKPKIIVDDNLYFTPFNEQEFKISVLPYEKLLRHNNIHTYPNILNTIDAAILKKDNFIKNIKQFGQLCPEIESLIDIFYNNLYEPTQRNNPVKIMYDIGIIDVFFNILINDTAYLNKFVQMPQKLFSDMYAKGISLLNEKINEGKKKDWRTGYTKLKLPNLQELFSISHKSVYDFVVKNINLTFQPYYQRIINNISYETLNILFKNLSNKSLIVVIRDMIDDILLQNKKIETDLVNLRENIKSITIKHDVIKIIDKTKLIDVTIIEANQLYSNIKKVYDRMKKIGIGIQKELSSEKDSIRQEILKDRKRLFNNNKINFDKYILSSLGKIKMGNVYSILLNKEQSISLISDIDVLLNNITNDEFIMGIDNISKNTGNDFIDFINMYLEVFNICDKHLLILKNDNRRIYEIINQFNDLVCKFKIADNELHFCEGIIKLIIDQIIDINASNHPSLPMNMDIKTVDIIMKSLNMIIPSFNNVLLREFGSGKSSLANILIEINNEIDPIETPEIKYYFKFICELLSIFYYIARINNFFKDIECNVGTTIMYIYFIDLCKNQPKYVSKTSVIDKLYNCLDMSNHLPSYGEDILKYLEERLTSIGYNTSSGVPDCMESAIRDFINVMIFNQNEININLLPPTTNKEIYNFYEKYNKLSLHYADYLRIEWIEIFNNRIKQELESKYPGTASKFFHTEKASKYVDMKSNYVNFTIVLMIIFGIDLKSDINDYKEDECINILTNIIENFNKSANIEINSGIMKIIIDTEKIFNINIGHSYMENTRENLIYFVDRDFEIDFNKSTYFKFFLSTNQLTITPSNIPIILYNNMINYDMNIRRGPIKSIENMMVEKEFIQYFINDKNLIELYLKFLFKYSKNKKILSALTTMLDNNNVEEKNKIITMINQHLISHKSEYDMDIFLLQFNEFWKFQPAIILQQLLIPKNNSNKDMVKYIIEVNSQDNKFLIPIIQFFVLYANSYIDEFIKEVNNYKFDFKLKIKLNKLFRFKLWYDSNILPPVYLKYIEDIYEGNDREYFRNLKKILESLNNEKIKYIPSKSDCIELINAIDTNKFTSETIQIFDSVTQTSGWIDSVIDTFIKKMVPYNFYILLAKNDNYNIKYRQNVSKFVSEVLHIVNSDKWQSSEEKDDRYFSGLVNYIQRYLDHETGEQFGGNKKYYKKYMKYKTKYLKLRN